MNKRSSIVTGDVTFKTWDEEFVFNIQQLATLFSRTIACCTPSIDLHWSSRPEFVIVGKEAKIVGHHSWVTLTVAEPITSGAHYVELEITETITNSIIVGLVSGQFDSNSKSYICSEHGYGLYVPHGTLYHTFDNRSYIEPIAMGPPTKIGLIVNMETRTLTFVVNDIIKPQAFSGLPEEVFVAVSMIHNGDTIRINEVDPQKRFKMIPTLLVLV